MPQKWAIWLAIEGDLRFLSHHDTVRALHRMAERAQLPLRYSQGFNPHPVMSLVLPRPVGVATRDDLLVMALDEPIEEPQLVARLNATAPTGLTIVRGRLLPPGVRPRPAKVCYELPLQPSGILPVATRLDELGVNTSWTIQRVTAPPGPGEQDVPAQELDLRPLVDQVSLQDNVLHLTLVPRGDIWARPGEVLRLLGLDERVDLAQMVRTTVDYGPGLAD